MCMFLLIVAVAERNWIFNLGFLGAGTCPDSENLTAHLLIFFSRGGSCTATSLKSEFNFFVIWSLSVPMIFSGSFPSVFSTRYFKYAAKWWFSGLLSSALLTDFTADDNSPRWIFIFALRRWAIGKCGCDSNARSAVFKAIFNCSSSFWSLIASSSSIRHLSMSSNLVNTVPKMIQKGSYLIHSILIKGFTWRKPYDAKAIWT